MEIPTKNIQNGRVRISTTVSKNDWQYAKHHNLKWSHCIAAHIRNHRTATDPDDPDADEGVWQLRKSRERVTEHRNKILAALRAKMSEDEFDNFIQNI